MRKHTGTFLVIAAILLTVLASGCSGREVFKCSSDNVLGLESVRISGKQITLYFDSKEVDRGDKVPHGAMKKIFDQGNNKDYSVTFFMSGKENIYYSVKDIEVNNKDKTVRIEAKDVQMSKVTGLRIRDGLESYMVDFKYGSLQADLVTVEGNGMYTISMFKYTQFYDPKEQTWSEPEVKTSVGELWT